MTQEEIAEKKKQDEATAAESKKAADAEAKKKADAEGAEPKPDPVKEALKREKKPEIDKAAFSLKKNAERVKALGGNPADILGFDAEPATFETVDEDDDKPITRGEMKRMQAETAQRTSLQLADGVEDPDERELTKVYIQTRIRPSGDPQKDFHDAYALVNAVKTRQIVEEVTRKDGTTVRRHSRGSGAPGKDNGDFQAAPEEVAAARIARVKPQDMEAWIKRAREGGDVKFGEAARKKREAELNNR